MTHLGTIGGSEPFGVAGFAPCPKYCGNGDARPYVEQDSRRSRHPLHRCCNLDAGDRVHLGRVDRGGALLRCYDNLLCGVRHKRGVRNQDSLVVLKSSRKGCPPLSGILSVYGSLKTSYREADASRTLQVRHSAPEATSFSRQRPSRPNQCPRLFFLNFS